MSEEIYYLLSGQGIMTRGDEQFLVAEGDSICIAPGTPHCIEAITQLVFLCCCAPAYRHEDTELLAVSIFNN